MNELEEAQQIAKDNGFSLAQNSFGFWSALQILESDDRVVDMWVSHYGKDPLSVAQAAINAEYSIVPKSLFQHSVPEPILVD